MLEEKLFSGPLWYESREMADYPVELRRESRRGKKVILSLSRLLPMKGLDLLIAAGPPPFSAASAIAAGPPPRPLQPTAIAAGEPPQARQAAPREEPASGSA